MIKQVHEIYYQDIKKGDIITIEESKRTFVVIQHGQMYHLIPIDINGPDVIKVNIYDLYKPKITNIFDGKNGYCKFIRIEEKYNV